MQTHLTIVYQKTDITSDISNDVLSFTYTDNAHGEADDIQLVLKDNDFKYLREWFPKLGDKLEPIITDQDGNQLLCGVFELDEFECQGTPTTVNFKAVSTPNNKSIRQTTRSQPWENVRLSEIAKNVAEKSELILTYATEIDPLYDRKDQHNETDLGYLKRLCEDEALSLKITHNEIVVFERGTLEENQAVDTLTLGDGNSKILSWSARYQNHDTASETEVTYTDPKTGKTNTHTEKAKTKNNGNKQKIKKRVKNKAEAERLAKAKQKEKENKEAEINISVVGNVKYRAGENIVIMGFGGFNGKYFIKKATHSLNPYTVQLELSKNANETGNNNKGNGK